MKLPKLPKMQKFKIDPLVMAFCIPFGLLLVLMILRHVTPFGDRLFLYSDEWHQYFPFFKAFRLAILRGDNLLYSWNVGLGMDYLGQISYYLASPLNLLSLLLPDSWILTYFTLLQPLKLSLASLFFAYFLKKLFGKNDISIAIFGSFYGLCAWAMGYQWNIMWLDSFALLPLVALGTVYLLRDKKFILYTVTLAMSILFNYYIGYFVCIFVLLLFICYQICRCKSFKGFFLDLVRIAAFSVLAICMTAVLSLPTVSALGKTFSSSNSFDSSFYMNIVQYENYEVAREAWLAFDIAKETGETTIWLWFEAVGKTILPLLDGMGQVAGNTAGGLKPTFLDGLPNVYCGVFTLFLAVLFLMAGNVKLRDRICCIAMLMFLSVSFVMRGLDYAWHGFHFPNMIPFRFSFIFSFVMLYMAYRAYLVRHRFKLLHFILAGVLTVEMFLLYRNIETIPPAIASAGDVITNIFRAIAGVASGNGEATNNALQILKGLYQTHIDAYIFLFYNAFFFIVYFLLLLVPRCHKSPNKKPTWEEKKKLALSVRKKRSIASTVLLAVMLFELAANLVSFDHFYSYTSATNYPKGTEYTASMIRYMKEREDSLFYRAETAYTQTLNDGALNDYNGISIFSSATNVTTTRFMTALGFSGQDNWNRFYHENGSPVANLFLNLKYMIEREGKPVGNAYFDYVHHYGDTYLYENNAYLPLGFLAQSNLGKVELEMSSKNAIYNQNLLFSAATGIVDDVWQRVPDSWLQTRGENVEITYNGANGLRYYNTTNGGYLIYSYTIGAEGLLCIDTATKSNTFYAYKNGEYLFSDELTLPQTYAICQVKPGDLVEIRVYCPPGETSDMQLQAAVLNEEIFRSGYEILNNSTLHLTEFSNTRVEGTIMCDRKGLLYTSIPFDKGWSAYVDGEKVDIIPVGGAMCSIEMEAGLHRVWFVYENPSFTYGLIITTFSVVLFLGLVYLNDRQRWNERASKLIEKLKGLKKK
ncbi:MAG: hypothetical protein E7447_04200 [Ruminococcaceae bacterium]|nr:hypothetical protein [Oscillospiraceae bacterium]